MESLNTSVAPNLSANCLKMRSSFVVSFFAVNLAGYGCNLLWAKTECPVVDSSDVWTTLVNHHTDQGKASCHCLRLHVGRVWELRRYVGIAISSNSTSQQLNRDLLLPALRFCWESPRSDVVQGFRGVEVTGYSSNALGTFSGLQNPRRLPPCSRSKALSETYLSVLFFL